VTAPGVANQRRDLRIKVTSPDDMMPSMRTTIRIDDELYRTVRERALRSGRTVGEVIEDAVRQLLQRDTADVALPPLPTFTGTGLLPGVDLSDNRAVRDVMDEGTAVDALR
jgi:Arc/MetJ family transcription regulator